MDVKEAVAKAKAFVAETFADENPVNLGLEEIEFDVPGGVWQVTVGFSRPWQQASGVVAFAQGARLGRSYKVVTLAEDGKVLSIKNRAVNDAA